jgi:hypothetical protein
MENKMGVACSMGRRNEKYIQNFGQKPKGKRPLAPPRFYMDLKKQV